MTPDPPPPASGFEALVYTDCRPDQGLQGTAGFQFQARSPGADQQDMALVERNLLYEAPTNWMGERRPADRYPPSLAHVHDGHRYATAAGCYLGREANGNREGNQLTHALLTTDPDAYGPVRPAQLFGASCWTRQPAPTTSCPPPGEDWEPGPLDVARARDLVRTTPGGRDLLADLVTVLSRLDRPDAARVLFVCPDPALVLGWITAATLLLPQRVALTIGFKVFTTRPMHANQSVLAVHPEWETPHPAVDNDQGFVVVDLTRDIRTPVEATPTARRWADLFLTADPYDVVDAVEVAADSGLPSEQAVAVAAVAVLGQPPTPQEAEALVRWLRGGPTRQVRDYGGPVLDTLVAEVTRWPAEALALLDEIAHTGNRADPGSPLWAADRVAAVRQALIAAELRRAVDTGQVPSAQLDPLPPRIWTGAHQHTAQRLLTEELGRAEPAAFEALLRAARRCGLTVPLPAVRLAAHAFAVDWAEHPEHGYDPGGWPDGEALVDLRNDVLRERVRRDPDQADAIADAWWRVLEPGLTAIDSRLDEAVVAAAVRHLPVTQRHELVDHFLVGAAQRGRPETVERLARILFRRATADPHELGLLARKAPPGTVLPTEAVAGLRESLLTAQRLPTEDLTLGQRLLRQRLLPPDPELVGLLKADQAVEELAAALTRARGADARLRSRLTALPRAVVRTHDTELLSALLVNRHPAGVLEHLTALPELAAAYAQRLLVLVRRPGEPWHVAVAFALAADPSAPPELEADLRRQLAQGVRRWLSRAEERPVAAAEELVTGLRRQRLTTWWQQLVVDARKPGLLSRLWHRKG
ncbi:GTPase-associated protein 1-related protein [Micromonospora sp. WMMD956]|uniref:GTPase-associated protein 1-related protein n=1 Tax=Micromonospora TaxID=1873 RepID=UPI0024162829|nr:GTPase-associated protein 1-related protein [Micromonospora sp. WMMD956]MDG4818312.1 GTPase-associated protein 1-related protein [Micromonospora sp. WMMD956]